MRIVFKILLFPITLLLSIIVAVCRFICNFSGALLSLASFAVFLIALLGLILPITKMPLSSTIMMWVMAFLISPFGLPKFADWLLDKLDDLNVAMKSI